MGIAFGPESIFIPNFMDLRLLRYPQRYPQMGAVTLCSALWEPASAVRIYSLASIRSHSYYFFAADTAGVFSKSI